MKVEILYFDGCPGYEALLPRVRALAGDGAEVELRAVTSLEAAQAERFLGSPTVRVDGRDVDPAAAGRTDFGLKCRLYPAAGGAAHAPPDEWIERALSGA